MSQTETETEQTLPTIKVDALHERLKTDPAMQIQVIDVRENREWAQGHIAGAMHISAGRAARPAA